MATALLGEVLMSRGQLHEEQLLKALAIARNTLTRLGEVLVGEGMIGYKPLYEAIAQRHDLAFVDLLKRPPDVALLDPARIDEYLKLRTLPYQKTARGLVIATAEYNEETIRWSKLHFGENIEFVITSPIDIHKTVQVAFSQHLTHKSTMGLFEAAPESSALHRDTLGQWVLGVLLMSLSVIAIATSMQNSFIVLFALCQVLYAITMFFKMVIYAAGMNRHVHHTVTHPAIAENDLPVYTVLIPMFKETESMPHLLSAMHAMDYPPAKLDVKLVLEEDDDDTLDAAYALRPRYQFDIIRVPKSLPRTKPKACNYALRFARGEFVTVYDADDGPDPQQLKKAVAAFRNLPAEVVCLQARLNYYNLHDNLLTRLFSLEYAMLFHVLLYGMSRMGMPVLLGGTSNHIALARLKELGEWDPYNVTEDADLGTRLSSRGYITAMLDSNTLEEAPNNIPAWFRQRARWIKGYIQTWLVHMRSPVELYKNLRPHGFMGFQCFVALSSFSYLTAPLTWAFAFWWMTDYAALIPRWLYALSVANLGVYFFLHIATALHISMRYRHRRFAMVAAAIVYPFYFVLHSLASYLALWQLITNPYGWNKTSHGKAKTFSDFQLTEPAPLR